jgi:hypothetical protein
MAVVPLVTSLPLGAVEAADQPDAGNRSSQGPFIVASSTRVRFLRLPPVARAVPPGRLASAGEGGGEGRAEEVTEEPLYRDRVCGIDIGKAGLVATIRVPSDRDPARRAKETRTFGATRREVLALADWLRCWQVPAVVMEATVGLLEGTVLPAGGRGVRVRAGRCQAGQEPAWPPGERLPVGVHDIWCRPGPGEPWRIQVMLDESSGGDWVSRRDERIGRPITGIGLVTADGIPGLAPEIELFYKADNGRPKDETDFAAALPVLAKPQRQWLSDALSVVYGRGHRWRARLLAQGQW